MAFCGNCGTPVTKGNGFCGSCGKQINPASQPSVAVAARAQTADSGSAGWTPVSADPVPPPVPEHRADAMAWSAVPNQPQQISGWDSIPAQLSAAASPSRGQEWSGAGGPPGATASTAMAATAGIGLTPNVAGALAYSLGIITGILFLVLEPYRRDGFVRFHAFQSTFYFVFAVAFSIAWSIVVGILMHISGWVLVVAFPLRMIIRLAMFGLWLLLIYQAYNEREFRIPILGAIASKQAKS